MRNIIYRRLSVGVSVTECSTYSHRPHPTCRPQVLSWPLRQSKQYKKQAKLDAESSSDEDCDIAALVVDHNDDDAPLELPSLFETCAAVILSHVSLSAKLEEFTPFTCVKQGGYPFSARHPLLRFS